MRLFHRSPTFFRVTCCAVCFAGFAGVEAEANQSFSLNFEEIKQLRNTPVNPIAGDFDGDGRTDMALLLPAVQALTAFHGTGSFTFGLPRTFSLGNITPAAVAAGDFNGDGHDDFVVADTETNIIAVLIALRDEMQPDDKSAARVPTPYTIPAPASALVTGDFNGDGNLDIAAVGAGYLNFLPGRGDGTFGLDQPTQLPFNRVGGAAAGNVSGDRRLDVVISDAAASKVHFYQGNGDGSFTAGKPVNVAPEPNVVLLEDVDCDRDPDLLVSCNGNASFAGGVYVARNANGDFGEPDQYLRFGGWRGMTTGDFNADGYPDIVVTGTSAQGLGTGLGLLNNGNGLFGLPTELPMGTNPAGLAAGDLNRDALTDLIVALPDENGLSLLRNTLQNRGSAIAPVQKLKVVSEGTGYQVLSFNYSTGDLAISPYQATDGVVEYLLNFGQWDGLFHYDYAQRRFTGAVYQTKHLLN